MKTSCKRFILARNVPDAERMMGSLYHGITYDTSNVVIVLHDCSVHIMCGDQGCVKKRE